MSTITSAPLLDSAAEAADHALEPAAAARAVAAPAGSKAGALVESGAGLEARAGREIRAGSESRAGREIRAGSESRAGREIRAGSESRAGSEKPGSSETVAGSDDARGGLASRSFVGLLVAQFLGAANDNVFRWLVVPIGKYVFGPEHAATALSVGLACLVLPFLLLAAPAGYLADRFSKRQIIVGCKLAEVVLMLLAVATLMYGNIYLLFGVLFLMGCQSALFGPAKYGALPELVRPERLTLANGVIGLTTIVAVVVGTIVGNYLYTWTGPDGRQSVHLTLLVLGGIAAVGWSASLLVRPLASANPRRAFPWNPAHQVIRDLGLLTATRALLRVALGIAFFWSLASLANLNVDLYGIDELHLVQKDIGPLLGILAVGVGSGSVLAGFLSRGKVDLGLIPVAAAGMAASAMLLFLTTNSYPATCVLLFVLGASGGMFDVPLQAYLQHASQPHQRGSILAASNFLTFAGTLAVSGLFAVLRGVFGLSAAQIFLVCGVVTVPVLLYASRLLLCDLVRLAVGTVVRLVYRVRVEGEEHLPKSGGALLAPNHVSWLDGVLVTLASPRPVRMLGYADYVEKWYIHWLTRRFGVIPIRPGCRRSVTSSLVTAAEAVRQGDVVCIFPEGGLTPDGELGAFKPGLMSVVEASRAPVIPVYLGGLWGSIFSCRGGRTLWKRPLGWRPEITVRFGQPIDRPGRIEEVRREVQALGTQS